MRHRFSETLRLLAKKDKKIIFLTGDLGFNVFEQFQAELKDRFINAGVAEQNMATLAAGLAYSGLKPWIYSIAPFVSVKILEQLRNDICLNRANVKIVGLGGGYDYEASGPSHHALEDIGALSTLPNIKIYAPAFAEDVDVIVKKMDKEDGPAYLRLTKARTIPVIFKRNSYKDVRNIIKGNKVTLVVLGSIIDKAIEAAAEFNRNKNIIDLWSVCKLPLQLPEELIKSIKITGRLCVVEECVMAGGLGQSLAQILLTRKIPVNNFIHLYARGYLSKRTGSRDYYLKQSRLDEKSIKNVLKRLCECSS